jgi:hypothetical protein
MIVNTDHYRCMVPPRRPILAALLLLLGTSGMAPAGEADLCSPAFLVCQREARLEKYGMRRTQYDEKETRWLLGNGQMGGLADQDGTWIPSLFPADLWTSPASRTEINSPRIAPKDALAKDLVARGAKYSQSLDLRDGVLVTRCETRDARGFQTRMFCSMDQPRLLVMEGRNLAAAAVQEWTIQLPLVNFEIHPGEIVTANWAGKPFTRLGCAARASLPLQETGRGRYIARVPAGGSLVLLFAVTTSFDGEDFLDQAKRIVAEAGGIETLLAASRRAWQRRYAPMGIVTLADEKYEALFYRSLYCILCQTGSRRFLPGESQFADGCWDMHPFVYGTAGYHTMAFTALGAFEEARRMLRIFYKPEAMRRNAAYFFHTVHDARKDLRNAAAMAFAHEFLIQGDNLPVPDYDWHHSRQGFGAAMFYRYSRYDPDERWLREYTYPVMRGTAEFWRTYCRWDEGRKAYMLPKTLSCSEDFSAPSIMDAVWACKWNLTMAARLARRLGVDEGPRREWEKVAAGLFLAQTGRHYLEYPDDTETRPCRGYLSVRAHNFLGHPTIELVNLVDRRKAIDTLEFTWQRHKSPAGMAIFFANWFALADLHYGRGDAALRWMAHDFNCLEAGGLCLTETEHSGHKYFGNGHSSFVLCLVAMALQSYDDRIMPFPAVPGGWKDLAFYHLPAEGGIRVSGRMSGGKVVWVEYRQGDKRLLRTDQARPILIKGAGQAVSVESE